MTTEQYILANKSHRWHKILDRAILMSLNDNGDIVTERLIISTNSLFVKKLVEETKQTMWNSTDHLDD